MRWVWDIRVSPPTLWLNTFPFSNKQAKLWIVNKREPEDGGKENIGLGVTGSLTNAI